MFDGENDELTNCSGEKGGRQGGEGGDNSRIKIERQQTVMDLVIYRTA